MITIIITTFRRPLLLPKAIRSCAHQTGIDPRDFEIVIVDNCPLKSAEPIVSTLASEVGGLPEIRYRHESSPGIGHARNAGLRAARGRFIVFIDDDQEASPSLLSAYLKAWSETRAAALFGPVEAVPDSEGTAARRNILAYFSRRCRASDLADITASFAPLGTNNAFFDRALCFPEADAFDVVLGTIGGEDTLLFRQLIQRGLRFAWAEHARAREFVPTARMTYEYMWRRRFRSGQIRVITCLRLQPSRRFEAARWMTIGLLQVLAFGTLGIALYVLHRPRWRDAFGAVCGGAGKLFWTRRFLFPAYGAQAKLGG
jgi:glycosyltransferase involved in cell wall biosynthesis